MVPHICDPLTAQPASTCFRQYSHLAHLDFADDSVNDAPLEIDMLIGSDLYWSVVTGEILRGSGGPIAVNKRLGWVLLGPAEHAGLTTVNLISTHTLQIDSTEGKLDATLEAFWELESLGVKNEIDPVQDQFTKSIQMKGGTRYHCLGMNITNHYQQIVSLASSDCMVSYVESSKTLKCFWSTMP